MTLMDFLIITAGNPFDVGFYLGLLAGVGIGYVVFHRERA